MCDRREMTFFPIIHYPSVNEHRQPSTMYRRQAATAFLVLLALSVQTQGKPFSKEELCDGCVPANTTQDHDQTGGNPQSEYLIRLHDAAANESTEFFVVSNTSILDFKLRRINNYEITILGNNGELYSMKLSNIQIGPGRPRNLHLKTISDNQAELQWEPPVHQTRAISHYSVSLKMNKLLGCEDLGRLTPPLNELLQNVTNTTALFVDLHPYAEYTATVIAHTGVPGPSQTLDFQTSQSRIPTSIVSNLRLEKNKNHHIVKWDKPADCTTISGATLGVVLYFEPVSDSVENQIINVRSTYFNYFDISRLTLAPYELYRVRVYVVRSYWGLTNRTNCQEIIWKTSPAAPSAVRNLEIYDADLDRNSVSLRWAPPLPANGEIERYVVSIKVKDKPLETKLAMVLSGKPVDCKQWENYVCLEGVILPSNNTTDWNTVEVHAKNKNVGEPGASTTIEFSPKLYVLQRREPSQPQNLTAFSGTEGDVSLRWVHPWITYTKLTGFRIGFDSVDKNLYMDQPLHSIAYPIDLEKREYSMDMRFQTGGKYQISLAAINRQNLTSSDAMVEVTVPELARPFPPEPNYVSA